MSLLNKISVSYTIVSLLVLFVGGLFFYAIFKDEVYEEIDEQLRDEKRNIERLLRDYETLPSFTSTVNSEILIHPVDPSVNIMLERKDTVIYHPYEENITFRQWRYTLRVEKDNYLVTIRKALIDLSDLSEQLIYALVIGFIVLLVSASFVNYILLRFTLRPFYRTLQQLRKYSLDTSGGMVLSTTRTKEFRELNTALDLMTRRIQQDYRRIKEFTENASHEIQTPLAIIQNKLELLMQSGQIRKDEADLIQATYEAVDRLSRLNQALILLTRIENKEFTGEESVNISRITLSLVEIARPKAELKGIRIDVTGSGGFFHKMDLALAEVMISNLLNNAIRYTGSNQFITVEIGEDRVVFTNPGTAFPVPHEKLFERFFKISAHSKSLGIGLALVKTITETYGLRITYSYRDARHYFGIEG